MSKQPRKIPKLSSPPSASRIGRPSPQKKFQIDDKVIISDGREGILRFYGTTQFADGMWCGIELPEAAGKHNGELDGVRYFTCAEGHGVFAASYKVRPSNYEGSDLSYSSNDESGASTSTSSEKYHKSPVRARSDPHQWSYTVAGKSQSSPGTESESHSPNKETEVAAEVPHEEPAVNLTQSADVLNEKSIDDIDLASDSSSFLDLSSQQISFGDVGFDSSVFTDESAHIKNGSKATPQSPLVNSANLQKENSLQLTTPQIRRVQTPLTRPVTHTTPGSASSNNRGSLPTTPAYLPYTPGLHTPTLTPHSGSETTKAPGPEMSTPFHGGDLQHDPFSFDEEEMAREAALVMAALQEAQAADGLADDDSTSDSLFQIPDNISMFDSTRNQPAGNTSMDGASPALNSTQTLYQPQQLNTTQTFGSDTYDNITQHGLNNTRTLETDSQHGNTTHTLHTTDSTIDNLTQDLNATQTLDADQRCVLNTTATIDNSPLNSTQTLQQHVLNATATLDTSSPLNNTQTISTKENCGLNTTQTLNSNSSNMNTTQTLDSAGTGDILNVTETLECHEPASSTPQQGLQQSGCGAASDSMKMSVDDSSSKAGSNLTVSMESVNGPEEIPVDAVPSQADLHSTFNADGSSSANQLIAKNDANKSGADSSAETTNQMQVDATSAVQSAPTPPAEPSNQMHVDEADSTESNKNAPQEKSKPKKTGMQAKGSIPDRRRTMPAAGSKPTRISKPRESLLPPPKIKEKEKTPEKTEQPARVIQKSKPKSKWANISKQIEQNAKSPKPAPKVVQSKLSASVLSKKPARIERTVSVSSDVSQASQVSTQSNTATSSTAGSAAGSKKPLKRQSLLPPSTSSAKQEFKKPRASLLPPPPVKSAPSSGSIPAPSSRTQAASKLRQSNKIPVDSKSKSKLNATGNQTAAGGVGGVNQSVGPPPDVVSSNSVSAPTATSNKQATPTPTKQVTPTKKASASSSQKTSPKTARANATNSAVTTLQSRLDDTQSQLEEALKLSNQKSELIEGLRSELTVACRGVEGLGVVIQYLSQAIDNTRLELVKSREESESLTKSHHDELITFQTETELLAKNHEEEKQSVIARLTDQSEREVSKIRSVHASDIERLRDELHSQHNQELQGVNNTHGEQVKQLEGEISQLKTECSNWKVRFDEAREALHKDMDHKLQIAMQPYTMLPQEIESLKTVIELKSTEVKDLRNQNNRYKQKVDTIPDIEKKLYDTEQRLENTQALLEIVSKKEKETAEKYHKITRKSVQEKKENHRLSLNVEALELKLEEAEFTQSMHMDSSDLDVSTASLPAYGIENPDQSPSHFTRSFARSSMTRRNQAGANNNLNNTYNAMSPTESRKTHAVLGSAEVKE